MIDGEIDRFREVCVVDCGQDCSDDVRVHLCFVFSMEVLMAEETLHPTQCQEGGGCSVCEGDD